MSEPDTMDAVYSLRIGDRFRLRGREFTFRCVTGWTGYEGRVVFKTWNSAGKATWTTVRATDRIEVMP